MTRLEDSPVSETHPSPEKLPCRICLKEIPKSEAKVMEGSDYAFYFCGLDCYEKWRNEQEKSE